MDKLELLSRVELFAELTPGDLRVLADHARFYDFARGAAIYRAGSAKRELFVVDRGEVRVFRDTDDGRRIDLARIMPFESFGEDDVLSEAPRNASAVAERDSRILIFPCRGTSIEEQIAEHPRVFARVFLRILSVVAGRIRSTSRTADQDTTWAAEVRKRAHRDPLTGLSARSSIDDELERLLSKAPGETAFVIIKPDNLQSACEAFGRDAADRVLRILADRLRSVLCDGDVAARLRGDELAVVIPATARDRIAERADELRRAMRQADLSPVVGGEGARLTVSVGVSVYPLHASHPSALVASAIGALSAAREAGGDRVVVASAVADCAWEGRGGGEPGRS